MPAVALPIAEEKERLYSIDEFLEMESEEAAELVDGRIIRMGLNNRTHAEALTMTVIWLNSVVDPSLGKLFSGDVGVVTGERTSRGADLAYVSNERLAKQDPSRAILTIAPELIIEIMSPGNPWEEVMKKLDEYFAIGVDEVWILSPALKKLFRHRPGQPIIAYTASERVPADVILSGAELSVEAVFAV